MNDYGFDPLGNGKWKLIPSGKIVNKAGLEAFKLLRGERPKPKNDCLGMSWEEIERKQGGKLKRN